IGMVPPSVLKIELSLCPDKQVTGINGNLLVPAVVTFSYQIQPCLNFGDPVKYGKPICKGTAPAFIVIVKGPGSSQKQPRNPLGLVGNGNTVQISPSPRTFPEVFGIQFR